MLLSWTWRDKIGIIDHSEELGDFYDTACVVSQLDLSN